MAIIPDHVMRLEMDTDLLEEIECRGDAENFLGEVQMALYRAGFRPPDRWGRKRYLRELRRFLKAQGRLK